MTDQPSQRAMKAAQEINALSTGVLVFSKRVEMIAALIEAEFPAYLEIREALEAVLSNPIIQGMSARIRDDAHVLRRENPLTLAEAALAKARKDK